MMSSIVASFWYRWHILLLLLSSVNKSVDLYKYSMKAFRDYFDCTTLLCLSNGSEDFSSYVDLSMKETCLLLCLSSMLHSIHFYLFSARGMEKLGKSFIHPSKQIEVLSSFEDPLFKQQVEWNVRQVSIIKNHVKTRSEIMQPMLF